MVGDPINIHVEMWLIVLKLSLFPDIYVRIARALARLRLSWLCLFRLYECVNNLFLVGSHIYMIISFLLLEDLLCERQICSGLS